jgi:alpha-tubulin suppressor-like RCC1 family protein
MKRFKFFGSWVAAGIALGFVFSLGYTACVADAEVKNPGDNTYTAIAAGDGHTIALGSDGKVWGKEFNH